MRLPGVRIAVLTALACGCGITVAGSLDVIGPGPDGGSETGASLPEGGSQPDVVTVDDAGDNAIEISPLDASFDANPVNCAAACGDAGVCDGGWCTIECTTGACTNATVVCPPGVPCAVACTGAGSCAQGVDCTGATACDIRCSGAAACSNKKVTCSGTECTVRCDGAGSCPAGVTCDAGSCAIGCKGAASCANSVVDCRADSCQVVCGSGSNNTGKGACISGVSCNAVTSCDITCQDQDTCKNSRTTAVAGVTADVRCTAGGSCSSGVFTSAEDAGTFCKNTGCGQGIFCDGGTCGVRCENNDVKECCKAATCAPPRVKNCKFTDGCP